MAISPARRSTRLLVYSHDAFGLGNLRRTLKICDQLAKEIPDLSILMLTGSSMVHAFRLSPKVDYVKLPCVHRQARNKYVSKFLRTSFRELSGMREDLIFSTFKWFKPHIVLVDKVPIGIKGELLRSIQWLKTNHPNAKMILGLRDILDDPEHVRKLWERRKFYDTLEKYYDSIWVFGSSKVYDMVEEYGFPDSIASKLNYCGYIMHSPALRDTQEVKRELGISGGKFVLVTAGGGGDGYDLMKTYLKSVRSLEAATSGDPHRHVNSLLILGPEMPLHKKQRLLRKAASTPGMIKILDFSTEICNYMNAADLVVSMGGYNTVCEILTLEKRAIVVPRVHPVSEQWIRTQRMEALGLMDMIHPEKLNAETLTRKIVRALFKCRRPTSRTANEVLDTDGLPSISRYVADEVRERTAS
ncbi:MAG: glycosyltransferase family protein [Candidatus Krumholzibacteriia bacterium]